MNIPLVTLLPYSRAVVGSYFYHQRGGKGSGYSGTSQNKLDNIPDSDGLRFIYKALKETDQTQAT